MPQQTTKNRATDWADHWQKVRASRALLTSMGEVTLRLHRGKVHVVAPYNAVFAETAKSIRGEYMVKSNAWTFPGTALDLVRSLLLRIYGPAKVHETNTGERRK